MESLSVSLVAGVAGVGPRFLSLVAGVAGVWTGGGVGKDGLSRLGEGGLVAAGGGVGLLVSSSGGCNATMLAASSCSTTVAIGLGFWTGVGTVVKSFEAGVGETVEADLGVVDAGGGVG